MKNKSAQIVRHKKLSGHLVVLSIITILSVTDLFPEVSMPGLKDLAKFPFSPRIESLFYSCLNRDRSSDNDDQERSGFVPEQEIQYIQSSR